MSKKVKYANDTVIDLLQEASLIQALGMTAIQSTKFEGFNSSDSVLQNAITLKSSMDQVLIDLQSLKNFYADIEKKKSELEKNIKLLERSFLAFQKEQIAQLNSVKKDYETKLNQTESETKKAEENAKAEVQKELARKERERNKLITDTEREVTRTISDAERLKINTIKHLNDDLEKLHKDSLREKQAKIDQYNGSFDLFMKDISDLKSQISKKSDDLNKIIVKVNSGKAEFKENENQIKSELKKLKELVTLKEQSIDLKKSDLEKDIKATEDQFNSLLSEIDEVTNKKILSTENDFNVLKESELEKLDQSKSTEEDKFSKLKESRATSIADLRAEQKAIMKSFEEKKDNTITVAERETKSALELKRVDIDKEIAEFKNDFENFRMTNFTNINQNLSTSVHTLTQKITLIS